jgi:hypothetical protein
MERDAETRIEFADDAIEYAKKHRDEPDALIWAIVAVSKSLLAIAQAINDNKNKR